MSKDWRVPTVPEIEVHDPPTIWIPVVSLFVIVLAGIIIAVLDWKPGVSIISGEFFVRGLLVPLLIWGCLCALYYFPYEDWRDRAAFWNWRCKWNYANWRHWTQWSVAIVDCVVLTPEVDLAERVLGLEGEPPSNAGTAAALQMGSADRSDRAEEVLEKLLAPLAKHFTRMSGKERVSVVLQARDDAQIGPLINVLQKLKLGQLTPADIARIDPGKEAELIDGWLKPEKQYYEYGSNERPFEVCLLIACQFHQDATEPDCTEAAVALLITSMSVATRNKFEPQAKLFRPGVVAPAQVSERLHTLLIAAPTPVDHFKHVWMSGLPKLARHNTVASVESNDKELVTHDLDEALGKPGAANTWLLQALAAQMVTYGQGPQLIAAPNDKGVMLNFVAATLSPIPTVSDDPPVRFGFFSLACLLACLGALLMLLIVDSKAGSVWFWSILGVTALLILVGLPLGSILRYRQVDDQFWADARR